MVDKKVCNKCNRELSVDNFYRNRRFKDGYTKQCKDCWIETGGNDGNFKGIEDSKLPDDEIEMAKHVLRVLGYIVDDPNNPVYLQFKERLLKKGVDIDADKKKSVKTEILDNKRRVVNYGLDVKNMSYADRRAYFNLKQKEYRDRNKFK